MHHWLNEWTIKMLSQGEVSKTWRKLDDLFSEDSHTEISGKESFDPRQASNFDKLCFTTSKQAFEGKEEKVEFVLWVFYR